MMLTVNDETFLPCDLLMLFKLKGFVICILFICMSLLTCLCLVSFTGFHSCFVSTLEVLYSFEFLHVILQVLVYSAFPFEASSFSEMQIRTVQIAKVQN